MLFSAIKRMITLAVAKYHMYYFWGVVDYISILYSTGVI